MIDSMAGFLAPGFFVDSDASAVRAFACDVVAGHSDPVTRAVLLFDAVRDRIWYDPFGIGTHPSPPYRASAVVSSTSNWCVPKAVLLAAGAVGIPARLGFADVRNDLQTPRLRERISGRELSSTTATPAPRFDGRWVKAPPAFNSELCARFGVDPVAFDGR